jgi:hypothetical protein
MMGVFRVRATEPVFGFYVGEVNLRVHDDNECVNSEACCIHHPSEHHMRDWPQLWRADSHLMERICSHGIGHPDPDDLNKAAAIHGCDGCCRE